jgi:hypothetical protein
VIRKDLCLLTSWLAAATDRDFLASTSASICLGLLTMDRQLFRMTNANIAVDVFQALNVCRNFTAKITLDWSSLNERADFIQLCFSELIGAGIGVNTGLSKNLLALGEADAEYVGQADLDPFVGRNRCSGDTWHMVWLALALLVAWILAENTHNTVPTDDSAVFAALFYRWGYSHVRLCLSIQMLRARQAALASPC